MVDTWLLMGSPGPVLCIVGAYLAFVLKLGPAMMEKRPALRLNTVMILYNAFQVFFSIWLASLALDATIIPHLFVNGCTAQKSDSETSALQATLSRGAWWYFFAKIVELLDTVSGRPIRRKVKIR